MSWGCDNCIDHIVNTYLNNFIIFILIFLVDSDSSSVMVYFPVLVSPECVHVGVEQHHYEGLQQVEQEPGINHLHVGSLGQAVTHVDKHRC